MSRLPPKPLAACTPRPGAYITPAVLRDRIAMLKFEKSEQDRELRRLRAELEAALGELLQLREVLGKVPEGMLLFNPASADQEEA